jgi:hypothetical protein
LEFWNFPDATFFAGGEEMLELISDGTPAQKVAFGFTESRILNDISLLPSAGSVERQVNS